MRTHIARLVASAAVIAFAAAPLAAQDLATGVVRPAPLPVASRTIATYRFAGGQAEGLPAEVTVADRGGQLVATYRMHGKGVAQPMMVTVLDADLILQAETEKGVLTLRLYGQNDEPSSRVVTGRWTLGRESGALQGRK